MKFSNNILALGALALPGAVAWGSLGHITVAYIATNLVKPETATYFQGLLRNQTDDYLAGVATWADSIRYTKWGKYTKNFHFIDAKDDPPTYCGVDFKRDCKEDGCVVSSIQNYTSQLFDAGMPAWQRAQAAKFVIHFIGDIHQPLHAEDVAQGGNGIHVMWGNSELNLHHVWDTSIAEKLIGHSDRQPYEAARNWASQLTNAISSGKFADESKTWGEGLDLDNAIETAMGWANQTNSYVCTEVFPEGPAAIVGQQLEGDYYKAAAPVVEVQVARGGYRLAAWLDLIVDRLQSSGVFDGEL